MTQTRTRSDRRRDILGIWLGCLLHSFNFKGVASRREYWLFLPLGLALPVITVVLASLTGATGWAAVPFALAALIPLIAVTARRARDSGENLDAVLLPTRMLVSFLAMAWVTSVVHGWFMHHFKFADGPGGFGLAILYWLAMPLLAFWCFRYFCVGAVWGAALFSQMAAVSRTRVGNEVTS